LLANPLSYLGDDEFTWQERESKVFDEIFPEYVSFTQRCILIAIVSLI
jgi:putative flippase GtrA